MENDRLARGKAAEQFAVAYLRRQGYRVVETNVRLPRGEIDVVAEDQDVLVFVEVRARKPSPFGSAGESINATKRRRMLAAAETYLQQHDADAKRSSRIDVVAIRLDRQGRPAAIELIKNALEQS